MKLQLASSSLSQQISSRILGDELEKLIQSIAYDTRKIIGAENTAFFALKGEYRDGHSFIDAAYQAGVRCFVVSKNVELKAFPNAQFHLVDDTLIALQRLAKQHRQTFSYPVLALTGSVGKTTVKEWLYHLLNDRFQIVRSPKSYNSQLGVALSLLEMDNQHNLAIIEAGISKAGEMQVLEEMIQADFGIFTAFGSAHAQNFTSKEEHFEEKMKLFSHCKQVFISEDIDCEAREHFKKISKQTYEDVLIYAPFTDKASLQNLSLALAFAEHLGVGRKELIPKIKTLPRLALRMEILDGINGNTIINDAYNADLDALTQSLEYQLSIAGNRLRTAIIGTAGLSEQQIQKIKSKLKPYQLYQSFFVDKQGDIPLEQIKNQVVLIKGTRVSQVQRIANLFQLKKHKTRIEVNLSAVKSNLNYFRSLLKPETKVLVMVKASAYGSGAEKMAEFLEKNAVDYLGVAYADEGIELRKYGIKLPILVMNAEEDSLDDLIKYQLEPSIYSFQLLESFTRALINEGLENYPIHLKFDTGMRRLGFEPQDVTKVIDIIQAQPELKIASVYSHLAESDNLESKAYTEDQIAKFKQVCQHLEKRVSYPFVKHLVNSEGIERFSNAHFDMVRLGIGLYGISVNPKLSKHLQQAISWKSIISQIKTVEKDESVGYSRSFVATRKTTIAIVPVGYADGLRRSLSKGVGALYVNGKMAPIVGNVCMDMLMIDVTEIACQVDDEVEIIGIQQSLNTLATQMQTIPYEVLTSLSKRLQRVYLEV